MKLSAKKILITAGPTWVAIDKVRVISNISTGQTGILLANEALRKGLKVKLILGPIGDVKLSPRINLIRFKYFDELEKILRNILKHKQFDIILHLAAVSDFAPVNAAQYKISSQKHFLNLKLRKTPKLVCLFKKFNPKAFLVAFKLENKDNKLAIYKTRRLLKYCGVDLAVLNTLDKYKGRILNLDKIFCSIRTKHELAKKLFKIIGEKLR